MTNVRFPTVHILFRNEVLTELQLYRMDPSGLADQTCFVNSEVPYSKGTRWYCRPAWTLDRYIAL